MYLYYLPCGRNLYIFPDFQTKKNSTFSVISPWVLDVPVPALLQFPPDLEDVPFRRRRCRGHDVAAGEGGAQAVAQEAVADVGGGGEAVSEREKPYNVIYILDQFNTWWFCH